MISAGGALPKRFFLHVPDAICRKDLLDQAGCSVAGSKISERPSVKGQHAIRRFLEACKRPRCYRRIPFLFDGLAAASAQIEQCMRLH